MTSVVTLTQDIRERDQQLAAHKPNSPRAQGWHSWQATAVATRRYTMTTGMSERVAEWRSLREPRAQGTWLTTTDTAHASTPSPLAFAHLTCPVHAFLYPKTRATPAQHHSAYQIMHQPASGEHHDYTVDVVLGLPVQPQTTTQLQGNELCPRAIHYADDVVLLFPQLPCLLSLLSYDALSHHVHVFLFVSVIPDVEMASHDETAKENHPAG